MSKNLIRSGIFNSRLQFENMSAQAYYTIIDGKDYTVEGEEWNWMKIMNVLNETLMPQYEAVVGSFCPNIHHFLTAYENRPIYIPASTTKDYSTLQSGQIFMLVKQDDKENSIVDICTNDPDIIREQLLESSYPSDDDDDNAYWEEDWGPV